MAKTTSTAALKRLQNPDDPTLAELAQLIVLDATETPLRSLASPQWVAGQIAAALEAVTRSDLARDWALRRFDTERSKLGDDERCVGEFVPEEVLPPMKKLLATPYTPSQELVVRIIDQPAMREIIQMVLADTVTGFRRKISSVDQGLLGGLGKRAAKRSRGLFGNLSGVAENLVGAVRDEVEVSLDGRVKDFVAHATGEAVQTIASYIADPAHEERFAEFRLSILDVVLQTPLNEIVDETKKLDHESAMDIVMHGIRSMVESDDFLPRCEERIAALADEAGDGTFGAWLDEVDLRARWMETTTTLVEQRLRATVQRPDFTDWWTRLHSAAPKNA